jgi:membrane-bound lytic murein transglycosylase B
VADKDPVKPATPLSTLTDAGVGACHSPSTARKVSLIRLPGSQDEYWLGFDNFSAITRYNHSNLYAMAVFQLSQEIKRLSEEPGRQAIARD